MSLLPRQTWKLSLAIALAFVLVDSVARMRGVDALSSANIGGTRAIQADSATASGYEFNQHGAILPILGTDGYQWAMQTQQMLVDGSVRVRHVDYDGPPGGRDVHWSSLLRWWTVLLASVVALFTRIPMAHAVEVVAPWANTLILCILLISLTPIVARRFGSVPASLLAIGMVAVYPAYEFYAIGNFDHHGLASTAALLSVVFLLAGGAGWVKNAPGDSTRRTAAGWSAEWLPDERQARRWFVASGIAGGVGLWISAATQLPALMASGVAALIGSGIVARSETVDGPYRVEPRLWRVWGCAGAATSLVVFLIEYAPSNMAMRLEVNHPLYGLAWLGAGDLLCRVCTAWKTPGWRTVAWMAGDVVLIALVPAVVLFVPASFVLRPDSLIMALHEDYIDEFQTLARQVSSWSFRQFIAGVGFLPLLLIGPAVALSTSTRVAKPLRAVAILSLLPALAFTLMAFRHGRWLEIALTLWLATCVAVATIATVAQPDLWVRRLAKPVVVFCVALAFAPFPAYAAYQWATSGFTSASTTSALTQVVVRDVSHKLRARLGPDRGVIASGPTTTTWLVYFGGFKGVGTLYWENHEGLLANARFIGATSSDSTTTAADVAFDEARRIGVTHIVLFSWGPFTTEYARLARGIRAPTVLTSADDEMVSNAFGPQLLRGAVPGWLRPLPYRVPPIPGLEDAWVLVLEVAPGQAPKEAATRFAQYALALNEEANAVGQLRDALEMDSTFIPALVTLARIQQANPAHGEFQTTLRRIAARGRALDSLALEDAIGLASVYSLAGDTTRARQLVRRVLLGADERSVRRLPWDYSAANFVVLANQLGLQDVRPDILDFTYGLLDPGVQAQLTNLRRRR